MYTPGRPCSSCPSSTSCSSSFPGLCSEEGTNEVCTDKHLTFGNHAFMSHWRCLGEPA